MSTVAAATSRTPQKYCGKGPIIWESGTQKRFIADHRLNALTELYAYTFLPNSYLWYSHAKAFAGLAVGWNGTVSANVNTMAAAMPAPVAISRPRRCAWGATNAKTTNSGMSTAACGLISREYASASHA